MPSLSLLIQCTPEYACKGDAALLAIEGPSPHDILRYRWYKAYLCGENL